MQELCVLVNRSIFSVLIERCIHEQYDYTESAAECSL